jgi:4-hydroxy-tetrahydrodipicolinate reductase
VHAIRLQGLLAHQEVMFGNEGEVLTIRHDTMDRGAFMSGIYLAIEKLPALHAGFTVGIDWVFTE